MNIIRYIGGVILGFILGGFVNMGLVTLGGALIPAPAGLDMTTAEGLKAAMPLLEPKNFIFPFLAHSLGTFVSALVVALIVPRHKLNLALLMGFLGLLGGIAAVAMFGGPIWFIFLDLGLAYLPVALCAAWLAGRLTSSQS